MNPRSRPLSSLVFTDRFLAELTGPRSPFTGTERRKIIKALELLDSNERHPSLEVHQLVGDRRGQWAAKADAELRLTFERLPGGAKVLLGCTHHHA